MHGGAAVGLANVEDVGASAVGVPGRVVLADFGEVDRLHGVMGLAPGLGHDHPGGDLFDEDRVRHLGDDVDGEVVDLLHVLDRLEVRIDLAARPGGPVPGEDHVVGGEILAFLEFDAVAQVEAPSGRVRRFPTLGEGRLDLEIAVTTDQRVVEVLREGEEERLAPRVRIHRVRVTVVGETEVCTSSRVEAGKQANGHQSGFRENS